MYKELKAKRLKKIKSKLYHKIRNRRKQKSEATYEEMEKAERQRALVLLIGAGDVKAQVQQ